MMIRTIGPANERGGRTGRIGGVGGGACIVLAIFHLAIHLSRRLLLRRGAWRRLLCEGGIISEMPSFHELQNPDDQQYQRPRASKARHLVPVVMQVVEEKNHTQGDQHRRPHKGSVAIVASCGRTLALGE